MNQMGTITIDRLRIGRLSRKAFHSSLNAFQAEGGEVTWKGMKQSFYNTHYYNVELKGESWAAKNLLSKLRRLLM